MNEEKRMEDIIDRIKNRRNELMMSYQDLADKTGLSKSTLQRYETGSIKNMPIDKLGILAKALNANPVWLMGYDIPKEIPNYINSTSLSQEETTLIENYNKLNSKGKERLIDYSDELTTNIKYMDNSNNEITATIDNVTNVDFNSNNKDDDEEVFVPYKSLDEIDGCNAAHADDLTEEEKAIADQIILDDINEERFKEWKKKHNK